MLPDGTWGFVSSSDPVGKNPDITQIRNSGFCDFLKDEDVVMDKGYQECPFTCCILFQQPRIIRGQLRQHLPANQKEYNTQLNAIK